MKTAHWLGAGSQSISYLLGATVITLALTVVGVQMGVTEIADRAYDIFGLTFITVLGLLVLAALFCWQQMNSGLASDRKLWLEAGVQSANGVTTLALTYTLLGVSLGIGTLSDQPLTPESVQPIIQGLTKHFSLAFMTTVVGLPISAILRALLMVNYAALQRE